MTEYTLKQMLDKLERNPNLKFKYVGDEDHGVEKGGVIHLTENGYIVNKNGTSILSCFSLNSRFTLVNEPVDRMTAFKAFENGKTICCDYEDEKCRYVPSSVYRDTLVDTQGYSISVKEILHGKWFIEEGE